MSATIRIKGGVYTVKDARWSGPQGIYLEELQRVAGLNSVNSFEPNEDGARARLGAQWTGGEVLDEGNVLLPQPESVPPGFVF